MISLSGTLVIKIINGRHGEFRVGCLQTEIGEFAVKDRVLDQYDEGCYEGVFGISKIFSSSYATSNRLVIEVRAVLTSIALAAVDVVQQDQMEPLEQDPLEEEKVSIHAVNTSELPDYSDTEVSAGEGEDEAPVEENADATLFGLLWPLQHSMKLDPTVDRQLFRQQRDRLKALGYQFKPVGQLWIKE